MAKNIKILAAILFISSVNICHANPIVVGVPYGGKLSIATNLGLLINFAADFVALLVGFSIIRNIKTVATWRFLPYFLIVFFGGVVIDVIAIVPFKLFFMFIPIENIGIFILFCVAGLLLYVFNSWLSDTFFDLEDAQKITIGIVMALLTNPVLGWMFAG